MSILTSGNDPLENKRMFIGAKNVEGSPSNEMIFSTFVIDWYSIVPEAYFNEYLPDNLKNLDLVDPVHNTYFLLYITDNYESAFLTLDESQGLASLQRINLYDNQNNFLSLDLMTNDKGESVAGEAYSRHPANMDNCHPSVVFKDKGVKYTDDHYPTKNDSGNEEQWAGYRDNETIMYFGNANRTGKMGDRAGDPTNRAAWVIGRYNGALNYDIPKYQLRVEWENTGYPSSSFNKKRQGRIPSCWKLYQSTNTTNPTWKLLDSRYLDKTMYQNYVPAAHPANAFDWVCNHGNF